MILGKTNLSVGQLPLFSPSVDGPAAAGDQSIRNCAQSLRSVRGRRPGSHPIFRSVFRLKPTEASSVPPMPAAQGLKPRGMTSRAGIVPISHTRTLSVRTADVADVAVALGGSRATFDGQDPSDRGRSAGPAGPLLRPTNIPYRLRSFNPNGLQGAKLGLHRSLASLT